MRQRRTMISIWSLDRLSKLEIFYESTKFEQKTSLLDIILVKIWLYLKTCLTKETSDSKWHEQM